MTPPQPAQSGPSMPPEAMFMQLSMGFFISQAIYAATELNIADHLANGPKPVSELANSSGSHQRSLYRLLRTLASVGVFAERDDRHFENTPMSAMLISANPKNSRALVQWMVDPEHWKVYSGLLDSVREGRTVWEDFHGEPVFDYLFKTNQPLGDTFNRAMTSFSQVTIPAILSSYDFSGASVIADIAGGYGHLLGAILKENPHARGILFDLPHVLEGAPAMLESYGVKDRTEIVGGNFLESIPVSADIYVLKHIIHDWYDETNETILGNIRSSMPDDAKILIIDAVIPPGNDPHPGKVLDLEMMIAPGGVERTEAEFTTLLENSRLKLSKIIPTPSPVSIVEAVKA